MPTLLFVYIWNGIYECHVWVGKMTDKSEAADCVFWWKNKNLNAETKIDSSQLIYSPNMMDYIDERNPFMFERIHNFSFHKSNLFFFLRIFHDIGHSITCSAYNTFIDSMGSNAMVSWSNEFKNSCFCL